MTPEEIAALSNEKLIEAIMYLVADHTKRHDAWNEAEELIWLYTEALRRMEGTGTPGVISFKIQSD